MVKKKIRNKWPTIAFRVHTSLYEWIEQQAVDGESPHQVVHRLVKELASNDGTQLSQENSSLVDMQTIDNRIERLNNMIVNLDTATDNRFEVLDAVINTVEDSLKQLKCDVANLKL